jgi:hypothetical protein
MATARALVDLVAPRRTRRALEPTRGTRVLGDVVPRYDIEERHETRVRASAERVFEEALRVDMGAVPLARWIFPAREILLRTARAEGAARPRGLVEETTRLGWRVLVREEGRLLVLGAVTKPWEPNVVFRGLARDELAAFDEPGWVKIAWTLEAEPLTPSLARFRTETRAFATDEDARRRFRRYWRLVSPGVVLLRLALLRAVRVAAER